MAREITLPIPILLIIMTISAFLVLSLFQKNIRVKLNKISFTVSVILVFDLLFLIYAFKYVNFATVIGLHYFGPIIVTIVSPVILKEKIKLNDIVFSMIGFIGVIILLIHELSFTSININHRLGVIVALLSAFTLAGNILYQRLYMKTMNNYINAVKEYNFNMFLIFLFVVLPLWFFADIDNFGNNIKDVFTVSNLLMAIIAGIFIQGLAMILFNSSIRFISASNVAKMAYTEVMWVILLGAIIYHENIYPSQVLGITLILLSTFKGIKNGT